MGCSLFLWPIGGPFRSSSSLPRVTVGSLHPDVERSSSVAIGPSATARSTQRRSV
jgi:hypothetical protein